MAISLAKYGKSFKITDWIKLKYCPSNTLTNKKNILDKKN